MKKAFAHDDVISCTTPSNKTAQQSNWPFFQSERFAIADETGPVEAIRLTGAQLDDAFIAMACDVVDEEEATAIFLTVESRQLQGLRYQGEVYRLIESFAANHRLQAFCLGQTLSEQLISYLITQSGDRFAVWVNISALPHRSYRDYLPTATKLSKLGD